MSGSEQWPGVESVAFVEGLYADFLRDPASVPPQWREQFERLGGGDGFKLAPTFRPRSIFEEGTRDEGRGTREKTGIRDQGAGISDEPSTLDLRPSSIEQPSSLQSQHRVDQLVQNYRIRGHAVARINPLGLARPVPPELDPQAAGLGPDDMDRQFVTDLAGHIAPRRLSDILDVLRASYCGPLAVQFMHIDSLAERRWLQERIEQPPGEPELAGPEQVRLLTRLIDAVLFERTIQKRFVGAKSFSLEGAEGLIPLLDLAIETAGQQGADEIVLGMAHRGRLNVLANVIGRSVRSIFREFADADPELLLHGGDVKYHQGYSGDWKSAAGRTVHLSLCFNPSHLEFIDPVALGRVRAKQDRAIPPLPLGEGRGSARRSAAKPGEGAPHDAQLPHPAAPAKSIVAPGIPHPAARKLCILIHGDAAFAGEGVVQETLNLSGLAGYSTGGAIHIVLDNQIGFTTPPQECRSGVYSTDAARMLQIPIFHVNGEDPEALARAVRLAMEFRQTFGRDVVIEMVCYRRHGHNETDEPRFTQPVLYRTIDSRQPMLDALLEKLKATGALSAEQAERILAERRERLEQSLSAEHDEGPLLREQYQKSVWKSYFGGPETLNDEIRTNLDRLRLAELLEGMTRLPEEFHLHPKLEKFIAARRKLAEHAREPSRETASRVDWSTAEALAFASLAAEGRPVRLSGQDTARGTFSQRHAVFYDAEDGQAYEPLQHVAAGQAPVRIFNSPLSEAGALGFEYGYSLDAPHGLVLWEAQFGDFVNAAQAIVDQFIVSAQDKWCRLSGLVLLLPHGLEGMGPEHSSARLERFLQLAADDNIQIVYPTTAAQYFHVLRRQALRRWRKPLVIMTPKSLLRDPRAASPLEDFATGGFQRVIPDELLSRERQRARSASRILLCTGKVYHELAARRQKLRRDDVAIIRVEQLYPLAAGTLREALAAYPDSAKAVWVQEEPANQGAWSFVWAHWGPKLLGRFELTCVARPAMTSPASGSAASHQLGQERLLDQAFE